MYIIDRIDYVIIVYFGQFFKYKKLLHFYSTVFLRIDYVIILTKNGLYHVFGDFFHKLVWSP
jgi:hypothetical protein